MNFLLSSLKCRPVIIDYHIENIINKDTSDNNYSENAKTADLRPIFKDGDRTKIKNYMPVSLLNIFSKFISAYRICYCSNHVLVRLIKSWKKSLDQKMFFGQCLRVCQKLSILYCMTFLLQRCILTVF